MIPKLKLDSKSKLYVRIPKRPKFEEDEVEIWLDTSEEKICLFKDSLHYVLAMEGAWVVERCGTQADVCFPRLFVDYCSGKTTDNSYLNHLLADYHKRSTWLTKTACGDITLEIWKLDAFSEPVICEFRYSFTISSHDFMEWWHQLMAMDHLT